MEPDIFDDLANSYLGVQPKRTLSPDEDLAVRTVIGEAKGEGRKGWEWVGGVIRNRAKQSGKSIKDVVLAPNQFEPWSSRKKELEGYDPNSATYQQVADAVLPILRDESPDPTNGATHFYSPTSQAALGRNAPSWDKGNGVDVGRHRFFRLGYSGNGKHGTAQSNPYDALANSYLDANPFDDLATSYLNQPNGGGVNPTTPNVQAEAPVTAPESPATLEAQRQSAAMPQSPRVGTLYTPGEQVPPVGADETDLPLADGRVFRAPTAKLSAFLADNQTSVADIVSGKVPISSLIGKVADVQDTSQGPTVLTTAPDGTELSASITPTPEDAQKQVAVDQVSFPNSQSQIVDAQDVVDGRSLMHEQGQRLPLPVHTEYQDFLKQTGLPDNQASIDEFNLAQKVSVEGANRQNAKDATIANAQIQKQNATRQAVSNVPAAQREPTQFKAGNRLLGDEELLNTVIRYPVDFPSGFKGNKEQYAVEAARKGLMRDFGLSYDQAKKAIGDIEAVGDASGINAVVSRRDLASVIGADKVRADYDKERAEPTMQGVQNVFEQEGKAPNLMPRGTGVDDRQETDPLMAQAKANINFDPFTLSTDANIQAEYERLKRTSPTEEETENLKGIGNLLKVFDTSVGVNTGLMKGAGWLADIGAGIYKLTPLGMAQYLFGQPIRGTEALNSLGNQARLVAAASKKDGFLFDVTDALGSAAVQIPVYVGMSALPGGAVMTFASTEGLGSLGRGENLLQVGGNTLKGAALGLVFQSAPRIGRLVSENTERAFINPVFDKGKTAAADIVLASKILGTTATLGTIGTGTFAVEKAAGASTDDAFHSAIVNTLFGLTQLGDLKGLIGKTFRMYKGKKSADVTIDPDGSVKLLKGQAPPEAVDAEINVDKVVDMKPDTEGVYRTATDTEPVRTKETVAQLGEAPPKRISKPLPDAVQKAAIDSRARKVIDALQGKDFITIDEIAKTAKINKPSAETAVLTLYGAGHVELLPGNRVRLINGEEIAKQTDLFERAKTYGQTPEISSQPAQQANLDWQKRVETRLTELSDNPQAQRLLNDRSLNMMTTGQLKDLHKALEPLDATETKTAESAKDISVTNEGEGATPKITDSKPKSAEPQSLSQYVRRAGGMRPTKWDSGEANRLRNKEAGTTGLINKNATQTVEQMAQSAWQMGYLRDVFPTMADVDANTFLEHVENDLTGVQKHYEQGETGTTRSEADQEALYFADQTRNQDIHDRLQSLDEKGFERVHALASLMNDDADAKIILYKAENYPDGISQEERVRFLRRAKSYGVPREHAEALLDNAARTNEARSAQSQVSEPIGTRTRTDVGYSGEEPKSEHIYGDAYEPEGEVDTSFDPAELEKSDQPETTDSSPRTIADLTPSEKSAIKRDLAPKEHQGKGKLPSEVARSYGLPQSELDKLPPLGEVGQFGQTSHIIKKALSSEENDEVYNAFAKIFAPSELRDIEPEFPEIVDRAGQAANIVDAIAQDMDFPRSSHMSADDWARFLDKHALRLGDDAIQTILAALEHQQVWHRNIIRFLNDPSLEPVFGKVEEIGRQFGFERLANAHWGVVKPEGFDPDKPAFDLKGNKELVKLIKSVGSKYGREALGDVGPLSETTIKDTFIRAVRRTAQEELAERTRKGTSGSEDPQDQAKSETESGRGQADELATVAQPAGSPIESKPRPFKEPEQSKPLDLPSVKEDIPSEPITDFGEKIGGARKDTAESGYTMSGGKKSEEPHWMRGFTLGELPDGKFRPFLSKGRRIIWESKEDFDSKDDAINAIKLVYVSSQFGVQPSTPLSKEDAATASKAADEWLNKVSAKVAELKEKNSALLFKKGLTDRFRKTLASGEITVEAFNNALEKGIILDKDDFEKAEAVEKEIADVRSTPLDAPPEPQRQYEIYHRVGDKKRHTVKDGFDSREDAMKYLARNLDHFINFKPQFPVRPHIEDLQRTGKTYRTGNVTTEQFKDRFGFTGGEFGNWVPQDERQRILNMAYDGLSDLADVLGVPPKALSLGGQLSIAFGSRGKALSGAAAHYERDRAVFNLTRLNGAGAVAHEWFHALDHYFGTQNQGLTLEKDEFGLVKAPTERRKAFLSHGAGYRSQMRPEVKAAFSDLIKTIYKQPKIVKVSTDRFEKQIEYRTKERDSAIKDLRDYISRNYEYARKKAPATAEQLRTFDAFIQRIKDGDLGKMVPSPTKVTSPFSSQRDVPKVFVDLNKLIQEIRGRGEFRKDSGRVRTIYQYTQSIGKAAEQLEHYRQNAEEEQTTPTKFHYDARDIDKMRVSDYWSTEHEMAARAFEGYVEDKLIERGDKSQYLVHSTYNSFYKLFGLSPYPEGIERERINAAFEKFFNIVESKTGEKGDELLYSKSSPGQVDLWGNATAMHNLQNTLFDLAPEKATKTEKPRSSVIPTATYDFLYGLRDSENKTLAKHADALISLAHDADMFGRDYAAIVEDAADALDAYALAQQLKTPTKQLLPQQDFEGKTLGERLNPRAKEFLTAMESGTMEKVLTQAVENKPLFMVAWHGSPTQWDGTGATGKTKRRLDRESKQLFKDIGTILETKTPMQIFQNARFTRDADSPVIGINKEALIYMSGIVNQGGFTGATFPTEFAVNLVRNQMHNIRDYAKESGNRRLEKVWTRNILAFEASVDPETSVAAVALNVPELPALSKYSKQEEWGHTADLKSTSRYGMAVHDAMPFIKADAEGYKTAINSIRDQGYAEDRWHREFEGKLQRDDAAEELNLTPEQVDDFCNVRDLQLRKGGMTHVEYLDIYGRISNANAQRAKDYARKLTDQSKRDKTNQPAKRDDNGTILESRRRSRRGSGNESSQNLTRTQSRPDERGLRLREIPETPEINGRSTSLRQFSLDSRARAGSGTDTENPVRSLTVKERNFIDRQATGQEAEDLKNDTLFARSYGHVNINGKTYNLAQVAKDVAIDLANSPRAVKASSDLSAGGRQGLVLAPSHPVIFTRAFAKQLAMLPPKAGARAYERFKRDLNIHPYIELAEASELHLTSMGDGAMSHREEAFMSKILGDDPYFTGRKKEAVRKFLTFPVRASERAYVTMLDYLRINTFAALARQVHQYNVRKGQPDTQEQYTALATWINNATGRGSLGRFDDAAPILNAAFFSARYWTSRLQVLNPVYYAKLPPAVRKLAIKEMLTFVAAVAGLMAILKAAGFKIETGDENNPDLVKLRVGNYSYDFTAGLIGHARYAVRMIMAVAGEDKRDPLDSMMYLTGRYGRAKLAPIPAAVVNVTQGKNYIGEPTSAKEELFGLMTPIMADNFRDAVKAEGTAGALKMTPEFFGISTTRYGKPAEYKQRAEKESQRTDISQAEKDRRIKLWNKLASKSARYQNR